MTARRYSLNLVRTMLVTGAFVNRLPAAVLTGAFIAAGAVAVAWTSSFLVPPVVPSTSRIPEGTHL